MKKFLQSRKHLACMLKAVTLLTFAGVLFAGLVPIPQLVHDVAGSTLIMRAFRPRRCGM